MQTPSAINTSGTPDEVARWVWKNLVPDSGQASSLQGELLRAIEKLRGEAQENGNINWDDRFEMFVDTYGTTSYLKTSFLMTRRNPYQRTWID